MRIAISITTIIAMAELSKLLDQTWPIGIIFIAAMLVVVDIGLWLIRSIVRTIKTAWKE